MSGGNYFNAIGYTIFHHKDWRLLHLLLSALLAMSEWIGS
jgi:hypothetical protein